MRGIIEGFYGPPWSWEERREVCAALAADGMDTYVYAPKDDPLHRERWREPYPAAELEQFRTLVEAGTLRVGVGISPGLSMELGSPEDRRRLVEKVTSLVDVGVSLVGLLLDDLDPAPGLGAAHGELTAWLRGELSDRVELFMVPLHYTGSGPSEYLDELAAIVPQDVPIGWTGTHVVNRTITAAEARAWRDRMGGRRPLLWDNTPVNDAIMSDQLFTGPLRGREPGLVAELSGYLANPLVQARAGLPALRSAAAWLRGEDPGAAWRDAARPHRVLLEGCDGAVPAALAHDGLAGDDDALAALEAWFAEAERCEVGDLGEQVEPWAEQLRAEAAVGKVAVQLLRAEADEARRTAPLLYVMWPGIRSSQVQVLGGRGALVPALGQDQRSRWVAAGASWVEPANVVDELVRAVFDRLP